MTSKTDPDRLVAYGPSLAAIRKLSGMTPTELAGAAGITRSGLWRIEAGNRPASKPVLVALASALGVDIEAITRPVVYVEADDIDRWPTA